MWQRKQSRVIERQQFSRRRPGKPKCGCSAYRTLISGRFLTQQNNESDLSAHHQPNQKPPAEAGPRRLSRRDVHGKEEAPGEAITRGCVASKASEIPALRA